MPNNWKTYNIGDVATLQRGFDLPNSKRKNGAFPVIAASGFISWHNVFKVKGPGVTTGRSGSLGQVFYVEKDFWPLNTSLWVKDFHNNEPRFIYYFLKTINFEEFNSGTSVPTLNRNDVHSLEVNIPDLPEQKAIASILAAIDDKIENNLAINKTLEDMAMALYKHWFVDFGPFQDGEFIDSELGPIPKGWEVKRLEKFCSLTMGQSPKSEFYNSNQTGLPFHQGVKDYGNRFPEDITYSTQGNRYAENGDVLFSVRAPVGRLNIAKNKIILGRGLAGIRMNENNYNGFLFYSLKNRFTEDDLIGGGTVYKSVNKTDLLDLKFIVP
ncbi:MAG: restriction endonuclease subunit S, partial [Ignavibacteriae bacterium]|nr:restriction endonuclease subunit S [Ignavibacteriota bacterium]